jgi:hypothetical protein
VEKHLTSAVEQPEAELTYERPRIEDYGTLAELTAGSKSGYFDGLFGSPGGLGYFS